MKSNKALRFIVLLIAVIAFFMVYASSDSGGTSRERTGVDTSFEGTYVYTFQGNNEDIFEFYKNGNMRVFEKIGDYPSEWLEDGKYTISADGKKIICNGEVHGITYFMLSDDKSYMTASNGWVLYKDE